jgi:F-type H+-transporting ATPase subunit epsilon
MATIKVDLVSPERLLASVEADLAQIPGQMGEFTALPGHAPFLSTLRPGVVTIRAGGADKAYFVTGGFAEVSANAASVLAEAEKALAEASDEAKPALALRVNDYRNAIAVLGL